MGKVTQPPTVVSRLIKPNQLDGNRDHWCRCIPNRRADANLKTGHLLNAAVAVYRTALWHLPVIFVVPVYNINTTGYELGGDKLPAPAAMAGKRWLSYWQKVLIPADGHSHLNRQRG